MHTTYSASNAVIEWLLVVKMLETEIHLFSYSAIPLFQLLSIVPAASNLPFMDSKYKFTTLLRKRAEHFSMYSEMSNYGRNWPMPTVILKSDRYRHIDYSGRLGRLNKSCISRLTYLGIGAR